MSGCGLVSTSFRAGPTRSLYRRALVGTFERGNETGLKPTAAERDSVRGDPPRSGGRAYIKPVARSPHTAFPVERSILHCLPLAWENRKGGTPFARFFPLFLAGQEIENTRPLLSQRVPSRGIEPPEASQDNLTNSD